jgi:hypothetical protein
MVQIITETQPSQTLIKMGRGTCMLIIKLKDKTIIPLAGSAAFPVKVNRRVATKYLLLQQ